MCWFLPYNNVNQLWINIHPLPPEPQSCLTLCDPMDHSLPGSFIHGIPFSRPEYWSGQPFPSPGDLPDPGIEPRSPALQADSLLSEALGKPNFPLAIYFTHAGVRQCYSLLIAPSPSPTVYMSVLYVCISIPALEMGPAVPFFQILNICVNIRYLFFSL